jgi:hypothetical protein
MKIKEIFETATAGATSAGNVSVGPVYPNVPGKQPKKKKNGLAPNALDIKGGNLLTGGSLVKR